MDLHQYDPAIGRWTVQDPVIHHEFSPYSAFDNNPVYWADPSGADAIQIGANFHFSGDDAKKFFEEYLEKLDQNESTEETVSNTYEFETERDGIDTDGGGGDGKNKGANSRGVGKTWWQTGLMGMSGYTFFGAPIRLIPYDFGASSYFGGAINVYVGAWKEYLKERLNSYIGRHLMHEYSHYLQEKYAGMLSYYTEVVPSSLESFQGDYHDRNWAEIQASTLAYLYFNKPNRFKNENIVNYNTISPYAPASIDYGIMNSIYGQYINHPDYKP